MNTKKTLLHAFSPYIPGKSSNYSSRKNRLSSKNDQPHYIGHRQRLRDRFMRAGLGSLADYELIELVLFRVIPKKDVKPLAKEILSYFDNDFEQALSAPASELMKIPSVSENIATEFKIIEAAAHRLAQAKVLGKEVISSWDQLMDYCNTVMAHRELEVFRILFLDRKNYLIADEAQQNGTVDHVPVYPREVVKRALELNASAIILIHNHPSGDPTPSQADIDVTKKVHEAATAIGVELYDHVVIGKSTNYSFRSNGLI